VKHLCWSHDSLDPSAWIKRHFQEAGSEEVNELFRTTESAACCRLGLVEMTQTIVRKSHGELLAAAIEEGLSTVNPSSVRQQ
jgi:hypothetical protein